MKRVLVILLFPLIIFSQSFLFNWDGQEREYFLYIPESLQEDAPLVFVLHGYTDSGQGWVDIFQSFADDYGFVVCAPSGLVDNYGNTHWNANFSTSITTVDDLGFLSNLAVYLQGEFDLDPNKTFACGHSNGGFMSWSLACNASNIFKAVASVTGTMSSNDWDQCNPSFNVPVMQISGTYDDVIPMDGSLGSWGLGWGSTPDIYSVFDFWSNISGCTYNETTNWQFDNYYDYTLTSYYGNCFNNTLDSRLYVFNEMGHVWPSNTFDNNEYVPDLAAELIWNFFMQIVGQPIIGIEDPLSLNKHKIREIDVLGREVDNYTFFKIEIYSDGSVEKKCILK